MAVSPKDLLKKACEPNLALVEEVEHFIDTSLSKMHIKPGGKYYVDLSGHFCTITNAETKEISRRFQKAGSDSVTFPST